MRPDAVIADWREQANVLRGNGHKAQADSIDRLLDEVRDAMVDYLTWLSESEAVLRSGFKARYFRSRFAEWAAQDMAEKRGRLRYYRQVIVPLRLNLEAVRADAEAQARAS